MAGTYNFDSFVGEDFDRVLTWGSDSTNPPSNGGPVVDLTDYTASLTLGGIDGFITTDSNDSGGITLGGIDGTIRLYIDEDFKAQFVDQVVNYRLYMTTTGSNQTMCLFEGTFRVLS